MPPQAVPAPIQTPSRTRPAVRRMAKIIVRYGTSETTHELSQDVTTVGRSSQNTVALKDISLSRTHCELRRSGSGWSVHDLGSRNGTTVNGTHVKEKLLEVGDKIEIGNTVIIYEKPIAGRDYTPKDVEAPKSASGVISSKPTTSKARSKESERIPAGGLADLSAWASEGKRMPPWVIPAAAALVVAAGVFFAWQAFGHRGTAENDKNLVKQNPSFEGKRGADGLPDGWRPLAGAKALLTVVQTQAHSGGSSLLVDKSPAAGEVSSGAEYSPPIAVDAGAAYAVSAWVRAEGLKGSASVRARWFAAGSDLPLAETCAPWAASPSDWTEVKLAMAVPEGAARMSLACVAVGPEGKAYFDDISVERSSVSADPEGAETRTQLSGFTLLALAGGAVRLQRESNVLWTLGEVALRSGGDETRQGLGRAKRVSSGRGLKCDGSLPDAADAHDVAFETEWTSRGSDLEARLRCRRSPKAGPLSFAFRLETSQVKGLTVGGKKVEVDGSGAEGDVLTVELAKATYAVRFVPPALVRAAAVEDSVRVTCEMKGLGDDGGEGLLLVGLGRDVAPPQAAAGGGSIVETLAEAKRDEAAGRIGEAISGYRLVIADPAAEGTREAEEARMCLPPLEDRAAAAVAEGKRLAPLFLLTGGADLAEHATKVLGDAARTYAASDYAKVAQAALDEVSRQDAEAKKADGDAHAEGLLKRAQEAAGDGHWNLAETYLRRVVAQFPQSDAAIKAQELLEKGPR